jgi:hypothetical protein
MEDPTYKVVADRVKKLDDSEPERPFNLWEL